MRRRYQGRTRTATTTPVRANSPLRVALPLLMALSFVIRGLRGEGDDRETYFGLAKAAMIICVFMQLLCASYHARLFAGTKEMGVVTHKDDVVTSKLSSCKLTLQTIHGDLKLSTHIAACDGWPELGASVPIITIAESTIFAQLGERVTACALLNFGLVPIMFLMLWWYLIRSPPGDLKL